MLTRAIVLASGCCMSHAFIPALVSRAAGNSGENNPTLLCSRCWGCRPLDKTKEQPCVHRGGSCADLFRCRAEHNSTTCLWVNGVPLLPRPGLGEIPPKRLSLFGTCCCSFFVCVVQHARPLYISYDMYHISTHAARAPRSPTPCFSSLHRRATSGTTR